MDTNTNLATILSRQDMKKNNIRGFTLIELMISLVLGLLIVAAVIQVYITMVRTKTIQLSGSEVQDSSIFGIQSLEASLRKANLDSGTSTNINDDTLGTGIILSRKNAWNIADVTDALLTKSGGISDIATSSSADIGKDSDQLTIQYKNTTGEVTYDCESERVELNEIVIERYFIRQSTNPNYGKVLACDSSRIVDAGDPKKAASLSNNPSFGDNGKEFIINVNQFKVLLGTQSADGNLIYYTPTKYSNLSGTKPAIVAIKIGMIVRGNKPVVATQTPTDFKLLGTTQTLDTDAQSKSYVRKAYESTTMLRNARVITVVNNLAPQ